MLEPTMPEQVGPQKLEEDIENMIMEDLKRPEGTPEIGSYGKAIEKVEELEKKEGLDYLTKIYNKEKFEKILSEVYSEVVSLHEREGEIKNALVAIFDLNDFKPINDINGHQYGDKVLIGFAQKLKSLFSRKDDLVARIGGDEFAVILPNISEENALKLFERIKSELSNFTIEIKMRNGSTEQVPLSASAGMCMVQGRASLEDIKEEADRNMYAAKKKHKDEHGDTIR